MVRKRITIIVDVPDYRSMTADGFYLASIDTFEIGIHLKQDRRSAGRRLRDDGMNCGATFADNNLISPGIARTERDVKRPCAVVIDHVRAGLAGMKATGIWHLTSDFSAVLDDVIFLSGVTIAIEGDIADLSPPLISLTSAWRKERTRKG